ncbi:carboxymuconolactone decarboxylase family protein [Nocardia sp. NPDC059229]
MADACNEMTTNPWRSGVLSWKFVELVSVGLAVACTNLDVQATRRHMRAALAAGATRSEIRPDAQRRSPSSRRPRQPSRDRARNSNSHNHCRDAVGLRSGHHCVSAGRLHHYSRDVQADAIGPSSCQ